MRLALLALLALILTWTGAGAQPLTVRNERTGAPTVVRVRLTAEDYRGGPVDHFIAKADAMRRAGQAPAFDRSVWSASTVLMGVPGACSANESVTYNFHAPYFPQGYGHEWLPYWQGQMMARYPRNVAAMVQRDSALHRSTWTTYPASVLPRC